jgi:hypothetical protein
LIGGSHHFAESRKRAGQNGQGEDDFKQGECAASGVRPIAAAPADL